MSTQDSAGHGLCQAWTRFPVYTIVPQITGQCRKAVSPQFQGAQRVKVGESQLA